MLTTGSIPVPYLVVWYECGERHAGKRSSQYIYRHYCCTYWKSSRHSSGLSTSTFQNRQVSAWWSTTVVNVLDGRDRYYDSQCTFIDCDEENGDEYVDQQVPSVSYRKLWYWQNPNGICCNRALHSGRKRSTFDSNWLSCKQIPRSVSGWSGLRRR